MRKIGKIAPLVIGCLGVITLGVLAAGFKRLESMVLFLNGELWNKHPEVMQQSIRDTYPFSSYVKDIVVCTGLYKNCAVLFVVLMITVGFGLFFLHKKKDKGVSEVKDS